MRRARASGRPASLRRGRGPAERAAARSPVRRRSRGRQVGAWFVIFGGFYLLTALLLRRLLPEVLHWEFLACAAWSALVALGLGVLGADYRRWWGLALLALAARDAQMVRREPASSRVATPLVAAALAVAVLSIPVSLHIHPSQ